MKINILKSSIKKNPNAGNVTTQVPGKRIIRGTYYGVLPDHLKGDNIVILNPTISVDGLVTQFQIIGELPKSIFKDKNAELEAYNDIITIVHVPEPAYLFEYENPLVKCSECGFETPFTNTQDADDHGSIYSCPNCHSTGGYPHFEFQKISEAIEQSQ